MLTVVHNKAVEEATSVYDPSSLLFGLDEYVVIEVSRFPSRRRPGPS